MARTVMETLDATTRRYAALPALRERRGGSWEETTWAEYRARVMDVARSLVALGVQPGEGVAIIGYNSPEWVFADVGAIHAGAIPAGIYTTSSPEQVAYVTAHCDARVAFAEDARHAQKFLEARGLMPNLQRVVQWSGETVADSFVMSWRDFLAAGKHVREAVIEERVRAQRPSDPCTLIYTSGTTGNPKGVLLTHHNLTWTAETVIDHLDLGIGEAGVSYLPLSHIAEQMLTIHAPMYVGYPVSFAESMDKLLDALVAVRPTYFLGVPRVWEKIQAKLQAGLAAAPPLRRKVAAWARDVGLRGGYAEQQGRPRPLLYPLAERVVFSKLRERLGLDRCRFALTGAAPISKDTLDFFLSLGISIYELYGMSECTGPATFSTPTHYKTGAVGLPVPGTKVKIAEDGEILLQGDHVFAGYLKEEEATRATVDPDGWLHTGDIGEIDGDGYLHITDRKKELIITAGGENVAPQLVEGHLKAIPVVGQAVVIGDRRKYLSALLSLDPERVEEEARLAGSPARTVAEAATCATFKAHLDRQVEEINGRLARVQTIKRYTILPAEMTVDGGELTPTLKLRRKVIGEKYHAEIEAMYE